MSKSSKLSTAIKAFNVSECVKCGDEIQKDWLISEDLNHWAGLEVCTVKDLEEYMEHKSMFSDYHKDVHGFRPRWNTDHYTLSDWKSTFDSLAKESKMIQEQEAIQEAMDVDRFKKMVAKVKQAGAKDFMTALRWIMQGDDVDRKNRQDVEHFMWNHGILYSSYGKSLVNRICPIKRG